MYGSSFTIVTRSPRASSNAPTDALARPLPIDDTTPPVTNTNLVGLRLIDPAISIPLRANQRCPVRSSRAAICGLEWVLHPYRNTALALALAVFVLRAVSIAHEATSASIAHPTTVS